MSFFGLFSRKYQAKDPEVRLKAVVSLDDQELLAEITMHDPSPRVRAAAAARLTDQELLVKVALDGEAIDTRIAAVERIASQRKLAEIIKIRRNFKLMGACFARITDKQILDEIANDPGYNMAARRMAIENYADESFLKEIDDRREESGKLKTPEEIKALIELYGGTRLARALGKFKGSRNAILALGDIIEHGGEAADVALEYVAQGLIHANPEVSKAALEVLEKIKAPVMIAHLVNLMNNNALYDRIIEVLRRIDHPDARQIIDSL